ncbi:hypothetical protein [Flavobacterium anhuiense]|uniref:hypothetical protein n=1 Tax=Flavobacterium anhuiense TaxID=459526 RepID=UPI0020263AFC|nr:hypothetical protein [Flavobacterium anhuiense]URM37137.1 hypothetical protein LLY39_00660 [Flavobacterium anhuiense]
MTYDSLDIIPYKVFVKIAETNNWKLLSDTITDEKELYDIWMKLYDEHLNQESNSEGKRVFRISKEIDSLQVQLKIILMSCEALRFDVYDELVNRLAKYGYQLRCDNNDNYHNDINQIERESNALKIKMKTLQNLLPKADADKKYNVDDVMASYCTILGFHIGDFNTITYTAFFGYEKQANAKVKAIKEQQINRKNAK